MSNALDYALSDVYVEFASGVIIEKKKGFGADHQHVVDAHGHQILADEVVAVVVDGDFQLGADAIGTGHQDGFFVALG